MHNLPFSYRFLSLSFSKKQCVRKLDRVARLMTNPRLTGSSTYEEKEKYNKPFLRHWSKEGGVDDSGSGRVLEVNSLSKCQVPNSYGLGIKVF